jgi:hypothetical protein
MNGVSGVRHPITESEPAQGTGELGVDISDEQPQGGRLNLFPILSFMEPGSIWGGRGLGERMHTMNYTETESRSTANRKTVGGVT